MSTIYKRILEELGAEQAFGYETDFNREELKLTKSHHNDAFVIAGGTTQKRVEPLMIEQIRRHKRSMEQFYDGCQILPTGSIRIGACWILEEPYFGFNPNALTVKLPNTREELKVKVKIIPK